MNEIIRRTAGAWSTVGKAPFTPMMCKPSPIPWWAELPIGVWLNVDNQPWPKLLWLAERGLLEIRCTAFWYPDKLAENTIKAEFSITGPWVYSRFAGAICSLRNSPDEWIDSPTADWQGFTITNYRRPKFPHVIDHQLEANDAESAGQFVTAIESRYGFDGASGVFTGNGQTGQAAFETFVSDDWPRPELLRVERGERLIFETTAIMESKVTPQLQVIEETVAGNAMRPFTIEKLREIISAEKNATANKYAKLAGLPVATGRGNRQKYSLTDLLTFANLVVSSSSRPAHVTSASLWLKSQAEKTLTAEKKR